MANGARRVRLALAFGFAVATLMSLMLWSLFGAHRRLAREGTTTVGRVVEVPRVHNGALHYEYRVGSRTYHGSDETGPDTPPVAAFHPGDPITVNYLPREPSVSRLGDSAARAALAWVLVSVAFPISFLWMSLMMYVHLASGVRHPRTETSRPPEAPSISR